MGGLASGCIRRCSRMGQASDRAEKRSAICPKRTEGSFFLIYFDRHLPDELHSLPVLVFGKTPQGMNTMNFRFRFALLAIFGFVVTLSLGGCKANNSAPATSQNTQPAQTAQSDQQPSASGQPAAPAADQSSASAPAANQPAQTNGQAVAPAPQAPPPPAVIQLPAGTQLRVRLDSDLSSGTSHPGDSFTATVADDVVVNGQTIIPRSARAEGTVVDAKSLSHFKGGALLSVRLEQVHTRWGSYPVATSSIDRAEKGKGKRSAGFIGGGAGFGALIGGLAGGGKGVAIGALAGGGAGTAGTAFTGNKQIVLPAETLLTFRLEHSVRITEQRQQDPGLQQR